MAIVDYNDNINQWRRCYNSYVFDILYPVELPEDVQPFDYRDIYTAYNRR